MCEKREYFALNIKLLHITKRQPHGHKEFNKTQNIPRAGNKWGKFLNIFYSEKKNNNKNNHYIVIWVVGCIGGV